MYTPDPPDTHYEDIIENRRDELAERALARDDKRYGVVTDHLAGSNPRKTCICGKLWAGGQDAHNCRLLRPPGAY